MVERESGISLGEAQRRIGENIQIAQERREATKQDPQAQIELIREYLGARSERGAAGSHVGWRKIKVLQQGSRGGFPELERAKGRRVDEQSFVEAIEEELCATGLEKVVGASTERIEEIIKELEAGQQTLPLDQEDRAA